MTDRWPPIPKRLMARIYLNHKRRHTTSAGQYQVTRTAFNAVRITDVETGESTEWQIKRSVTGMQIVCVADLPANKRSP